MEEFLFIGGCADGQKITADGWPVRISNSQYVAMRVGWGSKAIVYALVSLSHDEVLQLMVDNYKSHMPCRAH
jgi:hypothetical protein